MASTARLDELKKKFEENPRRYFAPLANEHRKSGDLEQAIALCRAHLPQQPAHISGHIVLGQALFEASQLDESRDTFHTALDLDPENLIALRYLGDIARTGGDVPTARSWYQRVLEVDPRNDEIVALIRDLDTPAAAPSDADAGSNEVVAATPEPAAPQAAAPAVPAAPADDSRFAPLTLDHVESDTDMFASTGDTTSSDQGVEAFDANAAWSSESPTAEMPMLDVPELDPFDMPRSGTAESLFDMGTPAEPSHADMVLDALAMSAEPMDIGDFAAAPTEGQDAWSSPAPEAPAAPASEFEEGSFYLEPPPAAPTDGWSAPAAHDTAATIPAETHSERVDVPEAAASYDETAALDASWDIDPAPSPVAELPNVPTPEPDLAHPAAAFEAAVPEPLLQPSSVSESASAAPPSAAAPVDDGLGLEVMEFVPPSRSYDAPSQPSSIDADPLVGHMPELSAPAAGPRPDAFVTETMAELYLQQGFRNEALAVYHELLSRNPDDTSLRDRIQQIESGSMSSLGMATLSENVVESARKRQTERPARSVRSFFASLAGRRAPHPQPAQPEPAAYYADAESEPASSVEASAWPTEESSPATPEAQALAYDAQSAAPDAASAPTVEASKSAAEQMASFDPFADAPDAWEAMPPAAGAMPNEVSGVVDPFPLPQASSPVAFDNPAPEAIPFPAATSEPTPEPRATPRSLEDLFPEAPASPRADAAAQTLATAFGRTEPQGRPTRAASNELSLDRVFRGAPEGAPAQDGGFSFDQFFSDARAASSDAAGAPAAPNAGDATRTGESGGDSHDIEQFTAWLEGLKKK